MPVTDKPLYLNNLDYRATKEDIVELFDEFRIPLRGITLPMQPGEVTNKGYAFLTFYMECDREQALQKLNGCEIRGRKIRLKPAAKPRHSEPRYRQLPVQNRRPKPRFAENPVSAETTYTRAPQPSQNHVSGHKTYPIAPGLIQGHLPGLHQHKWPLQYFERNWGKSVHARKWLDKVPYKFEEEDCEETRSAVSGGDVLEEARKVALSYTDKEVSKTRKANIATDRLVNLERKGDFSVVGLMWPRRP